MLCTTEKFFNPGSKARFHFLYCLILYKIINFPLVQVVSAWCGQRHHEQDSQCRQAGNSDEQPGALHRDCGGGSSLLPVVYPESPLLPLHPSQPHHLLLQSPGALGDLLRHSVHVSLECRLQRAMQLPTARRVILTPPVSLTPASLVLPEFPLSYTDDACAVASVSSCFPPCISGLPFVSSLNPTRFGSDI